MNIIAFMLIDTVQGEDKCLNNCLNTCCIWKVLSNRSGETVNLETGEYGLRIWVEIGVKSTIDLSCQI